MPFTDISGDPRWQRLGEGLAVEISNELARNHWLDVRAPFSALQVADLKGLEAAQALGVAMLVDGTLQSDGEQLRVTASLTNAETRSVIWSDTWSGPLDDLFAVQDQILEQVGSSLGGHYSSAIARSSRLGLARKPTQNTSAFEHVLLATHAKHNFTKEAYGTCIAHTEDAIRIDPGYAQAWALKSLCEIWFSVFIDSRHETAAYMKRSRDSAVKAFDLDPNDPVTLYTISGPVRSPHNRARQEVHLRRAVELAPSNSDVLAVSAWIAGFVGIRGPDPLHWAERALALNPDHRPDWYHIAHGIAAYQAGDDALALEALSKAPKMTESVLFHAAAEWRLGNVDSAEGLIAEHLAMAPDRTLVDHFGSETLTRADLADMRAMAVQFGLPLGSTEPQPERAGIRSE